MDFYDRAQGEGWSTNPNPPKGVGVVFLPHRPGSTTTTTSAFPYIGGSSSSRVVDFRPRTHARTLQSARLEVQIGVIAAGMLAKGERLESDDLARLKVAEGRLARWSWHGLPLSDLRKAARHLRDIRTSAHDPALLKRLRGCLIAIRHDLDCHCQRPGLMAEVGRG